MKGSLGRRVLTVLLVALTFAFAGGTHPSFERSVQVTPALDAGAADRKAAGAGTLGIRPIGRVDLRDPEGPRLGWPGSALAIGFTGTGLDATLRDSGTNFFALVVDGAPAAPLATHAGTETYSIASGLAPGVHAITLTKRTESFVGVVQLRGLSPHDGVLVAPPPPRPRRIEYVGDSITCGYGDLGASESCRFTPDTEDEGSAYGALTADALDAERAVLAYSGIGMYRSGTGSTADQIPVLFERTLASEAARWSFATPEPDVVVITLGANDFAQGDPGPPFEEAYGAFLKQLRRHYPHARVVCALNPMTSDLFPAGANLRTKASAALQRIVRTAAAGDDRVSYFAFDAQSRSNGFGCDYHPSTTTHRLMARALVRELQTLMGW